ncbi:MAG: prephenate dehydrogenase/arogenate dehydrogenase family protein [Lachnospiraceae bacterium]
MENSNLTYGFIGLGLIGGSIARAIKNVYPGSRIIAYDIDKNALQAASEDGVADEITEKIDEHFSACQLIFLCAPVSCNDENLVILKDYISTDTLLTDVGSVKKDIHEHIDALGLSDQFIGGHPMAGSERIGYANSKAKLLENAYYILTPTKSVSMFKVAFLERLIKKIGALPLVLSCQEHDYATAGISHLPHVISASLVNLVKSHDNKDGIMKMIAAGGFKDITRISSSSPVMWEHICMTNTENILSLLNDYIKSLEDIRDKMEQKDAAEIKEFFTQARDYRESFIDASRGPIKKSYVFYVDIPDEPGALATIATLLAFRQISIKNIGITHNREVAEGSLQIEVYEEEDIAKACDILSSKGYIVHVKK